MVSRNTGSHRYDHLSTRSRYECTLVLWVVAVGTFVIAPLLGFAPNLTRDRSKSTLLLLGWVYPPLRVIEPFLVEPPKCVFYPVFLAATVFFALGILDLSKKVVVVVLCGVCVIIIIIIVNFC